MKRFLAFFCLLIYCTTSYAGDKVEPNQLYSKSAVLIDADSGRVLFGKDEEKILPMASTTKIMTCIIALEKGNLDDVVTVSKQASEQPKVHLGMKEGEQFLLGDLLYSLMLESHNDSAVAIAEHVAGSVEQFAEIMNQKAKDIGCTKTHFVTPNGLDEKDEEGEHSTTATELAQIMRYCIRISPQKEEFLKITETMEYTFSDRKEERVFQCKNRNSFLTMMDGVISGKTGYTGKAGYCYVGALERDGRTFIVSLLACGWPNNKTYKWKDATLLLEYALKNYQYNDVYEDVKLPTVLVKNGVLKEGDLYGEKRVNLRIKGKEEEGVRVLLNETEKVEIQTEIPEALNAPIEQDTTIGQVTYTLDGKVIAKYEVVAGETVHEKNLAWYFKEIARMYFCALEL